MNPYLILMVAVFSEVFGNTMLKLSNGFSEWLPTLGVIGGMGGAFYGLSLTLQYLPLGLTYAIWSGAGTILTALIGVVFWKEHFNGKHFVGLLFVIGGILLLRLANNGAA